MGKVILICGKICSGKTYYAKLLKEKENAVILSTDEVTHDLTDNAQGEGYDAFAKRVNGYLMKKAAELAAVGCNIILDWGFWTKENRREAEDYFSVRGIATQWHYIDIDDETWHRNIEARNARVLAGLGGSDFYVDDGLKNKVLSLFEVPGREEYQVHHLPGLTLGPIPPEAREQALDILTDAGVAKSYMLPVFSRREDAVGLFERLAELSRDERRFVRGIFLGGKLVGFLNDVEIENSKIELGYAIHSAHWGRGCATAALKLAIEELFEKGFQEVVCGAFEDNTASLRVMEKAGMVPLDETDVIEYRGRLHRCLYRGISK